MTKLNFRGFLVRSAASVCLMAWASVAGASAGIATLPLAGFNFAAPAIPAQSVGENDGYGVGGEGSQNRLRRIGNRSSQALKTPQAVAIAVDQATSFCNALAGGEYAIDCMAYELWEIQRQLPDFGEMSDVKKILSKTSKKLKALAVNNQSQTKPPIRVTKGNRKLRRNLIPVERKKLKRLSREAAVIINDGATLLLRASGDSDRKRAQYQQIARSMQTGALMLRSL